MLTIENIQAIEREIKVTLKDKGGNWSKSAFGLIYRKAVNHAADLKVHSRLDVFPEKLFRERAPNESEAEFAWRKSIYQPITVPFWRKAMGLVNRIWNEQNYSVTNWWTTPVFESETPEKYFNSQYPIYRSIFDYFKSVVTKRKATDPNALLVIRPFVMPFMTTESEELVFDETTLVEPVGEIVDSARVIDFIPELYALTISNDKSAVTMGSRVVEEGLIFEIFDSEKIYRLVQFGEKMEYKFKLFTYYEHNIGKLPCWKLRGLPQDIDGRVFYDSHFSSALPNLNVALNTHSTFTMSFYSQMFPRAWEYYEPCDSTECESGRVVDKDASIGEDIKYKKCPICKGTGQKQQHSPTSVYQIKLREKYDENEVAPTPPFGWENPAPSSLEFPYKVVYEEIEMAFAFLNIDVTPSHVKGDETALGKMLDRDELHSFLKDISDELFTLLADAIDVIGLMRYGSNFEAPNISPPIEFNMRSSHELTSELSEAKRSNIPDVALREIVREYVSQRFSSKKDIERATDLYLAIDPFATSSVDEVVRMVTVGSIPKYFAVLHLMFWTFLESKIEADSDYLDNDIETIKNDLIAMAKAEQVTTPRRAEDLFNAFPQ